MHAYNTQTLKIIIIQLSFILCLQHIINLFLLFWLYILYNIDRQTDVDNNKIPKYTQYVHWQRGRAWNLFCTDDPLALEYQCRADCHLLQNKTHMTKCTVADTSAMLDHHSKCDLHSCVNDLHRAVHVHAHSCIHSGRTKLHYASAIILARSKVKLLLCQKWGCFIFTFCVCLFVPNGAYAIILTPKMF